MFSLRKKTDMPSPAETLPGRATAIPTAGSHVVNGRALAGPYPDGMRKALFGLGCFWGAERKFWQSGEGIWVTASGYAGGTTPNPTYEEVCSGLTGHTEVVLVVFDPARIAYEDLLKIFCVNGGRIPGQGGGAKVGHWRRGAADMARAPIGALAISAAGIDQAMISPVSGSAFSTAAWVSSAAAVARRRPADCLRR